VSTLNKLASALQVPITAFFRVEPAKEKIVLRKASERTRLPFMRGVIEGLGGEFFSGRVEAFMLTLENGGSSGPSQMLHSGHEFVFVLRGRLEYEVDGQRFILEPGDSLLFTSHQTHRWRNMGGAVVNAIIVIAAFDEDERPSEFHVAAMGEGEEPDEAEGPGEPATDGDGV
jgi:quercetin dioxygenase-like cupin family protein